MSTLTYTGTLRITTCWCGIAMALPVDLYDYAQRNGTAVCCPLGHKWVFGDSVQDQLERTKADLELTRRCVQATREILHAEERSHAATRGHLTRRKKQVERVVNGLCPCCNRSFADLLRHMRSKHPDYRVETP